MGHRYVIAGAGSAGCILAARLSEDPANLVVLIEAGPDYPDIAAAPADIASAYVFAGTDHDWGYRSEATFEHAGAINLGATSAAIPVLRGKVVGGSSAVNGTSAMRPTPGDFARWAATGNSAWTWARALPYQKRVERDPIGGEWHGDRGPVPIRRFAVDEMRPIQRAFLEAAWACGYDRVSDHNAPGAIGAGPIPLNQRDGIRQSTAVTYLAAARHRPNLEVRPTTEIDRVVLDGDRATSVRLTGGELVSGDRLIVAAGSYGSPAILLRSGLGARLPAIGRNLRDHPMLVVAVEGRSDLIGELDPPVQTMLTLSSSGSRHQDDIDLEIAMFTVAPGQVFFGIGLVLPHSVGFISLSPNDPLGPPIINLNFYDDPRDVERMVAGIRATRRLLATPPLCDFLGHELFPGPHVTTDADLAAAVRATPTSYAHATGTCRMGASSADSVVDQTGRVHGVADLWVIDASIIPVLPCVPTNTTTMMVAERAAAWLRGEEELP